MEADELERIVAFCTSITRADASARNTKDDARRQAAFKAQVAVLVGELVDYIRDQLPVDEFTVEHPEHLPPLLHIPIAAKLCGFDEGIGYVLAKKDWAPFIKHFGTRGRAVRTEGLLRWLECDHQDKANDQQPSRNGRRK